MEKWVRSMYQPGLPLGKDGKRITACEEHIKLSKKAAKEGMVLLKNNEGLLPLKKGTKVALFGKAAVDYVKGGGGSGDVTVSYIVNLYQGFKNLSDRVSVYEELVDFYKKDIEAQYAKGIEPGMTVEPKLSDDMVKRARNYTDTAIISISRFSGEGWDRRSKYDKKQDDNNIFEDGDFYLTKAEKEMVHQVKTTFPKVIVVMNVGGMVDTEWFKDEDAIQSVLMAWQGGMEGGNAAAELICGIGNPSGKLADTFAKTLEDYPSSYNFHESDDYVDYTEDIYVGYRYFETIPGKAERVNYPFGYGLSYTGFDVDIISACKVEISDEDKLPNIQVKVKVTNTGEVSGKEVVQIYVQAPNGKLGKAKRSLVDFKKTRELKAGESQILTMEIEPYAFSSFDDLGKIEKSAYVLEKGQYNIYAGTSVRDLSLCPIEYALEEDIVVRKHSPLIVPTSLKHRMLSDGSFEDLPILPANDPRATGLEYEDKWKYDGMTPTVRQMKGHVLWGWRYKEGVKPFTEVANGNMTLDEFMAQLTDDELICLLGGQPNTGLANTCGFGGLSEYGVPSVMTADGPAGLRIWPECGVCTTAWPCATLLACTWDRELVYAVGEAGAKEVKENNISVWLTPAVNIHRSPLCGRNFEYYSEDPVLAGELAGAMVRGIQSQHIAATVKHFAMNNKETNRKDSDSRVSERAAREIYLKAFEIIVKKSHPWVIMSS